MVIAPAAEQTATNPREGYFWVILAAGLSAVVLAIGLFIFASNVANRELYHGWYLLGFFAATIGMGASLAFRRVGIAVFMVVVIAAILAVSVLKFNARDVLNARVTAPNAVTILGDYVRQIDPLEERWNPYSTAPNWVQFDQDCFISAMMGRDIAPVCKDKNEIFTAYRVDVMSVINNRFQLMKSTAQRIERKELNTKEAYEACLNDGSCAAVPLLPVDPAIVSPDSKEYEGERVAFWQLIEKPEMTSGLCDYMPFCQAMVKNGAVTRTDFKS